LRKDQKILQVLFSSFDQKIKGKKKLVPRKLKVMRTTNMMKIDLQPSD